MLRVIELAPNNPDITRATGFLARNWYISDRNVWLKDTSTTPLCLSRLDGQMRPLPFAQYDPITHEDYYRLRAFFEPYGCAHRSGARQADLKKDGIPRVYDAHAETPTYDLFEAPTASRHGTSAHPGHPAFLEFGLEDDARAAPLGRLLSGLPAVCASDLIAAAKGGH